MVQANVMNMLPVKRKKAVSGDWEQGADSDESLDVDAVVSGITSHQQVKKKGRDESRYSAFDAQSPSDLHGQYAAASVSKPKLDDGRGKAPQVDHAKQVKSDQVRRDAVRKNCEALKQKQLLIKKALTAVDTGTGSNHKVVFDSDDEQEFMKTSGAQNSSNSSKDKYMPMREDPGSRKFGLFDSDSDENIDDDDTGEQQFELRPQFEGKGGKELFKLQSRFGTDARFRVDARFADSDNDDGEKEEEDLEGAQQPTPDEYAEERKKTLAVLEKVIGARAPKQATKAHKFSQISRYDPTREDHTKFEIAAVASKPSDSNSAREKSKQKVEVEQKSTDESSSALPQVSKEKFFEVSSELKDAFEKKTSGSSFSFLSTFGNSQEEPVPPQPKYAVEAVTRQPLAKPWRRDEDYSSEEDDSVQHVAVQEKRVTGKWQSTPAKLSSHKFFFAADDKRISEGVNEFWRRDDEERVRQQWVMQRPSIVEVSRLRRKEALRREAHHDRQRKQKHSNFKRRTN